MPSDVEIPGTPDEWLARATGDLALASVTLPECYVARVLRCPSVTLPEGAYYEDLCYHAQQAAEKAVKAIYRARSFRFAYIHDIAELLAGLERQGIRVPEEVAQSAVLTEFARQSRYPGPSEPVSEAEYTHAVSLAEAVVRWAKAIVARECS